MRIGILHAANNYNASGYFAKMFAKALVRQGVLVSEYSLDEEDVSQSLQKMLGDSLDLTLSFHRIAFEGGHSFGTLSPIPHCTWIVDSSIYNLPFLQGERSHLACIDEEDTASLKALGCKNVYFLPHAAPVELLQKQENSKQYPLVFIGSCYDVEETMASWPRRFSTETVRLMHECMEKILHSPTLSCTRALLEGGFNLEMEDLREVHFTLDYTLRSIERCELLRHLDHPIHIWGDGVWEKVLGSKRGVTLHPAQSLEETIPILAKSRLVLNCFPTRKWGLHERIVYPPLLGGLPISTESAYLDQHFPSLPTYQYGHWDKLNCQIETLLHDDPVFEKNVASMQKKIIGSHTLDHRAISLLEQLNPSRLE